MGQEMDEIEQKRRGRPPKAVQADDALIPMAGGQTQVNAPVVELPPLSAQPTLAEIIRWGNAAKAQGILPADPVLPKKKRIKRVGA